MSDTPTGPDRRAAFLRAVRRLHAWTGLTGAAFGLLFGVTGFLMNHRAVLKIEAGEITERRVSVELEGPPPPSPEALGKLLAARFGVPESRVRTRIQAPRNGRVGGQPVKAAEQWTVAFLGHRRFAQAAYVPGNRSVDVELKEADLLQTLKRLHKNDGGSLAWTLLTDTFAGALVFLTLSGILLWVRLNGRRILAVGLITACIACLISAAILGL
jgi:hypothetical protein